MVTENRQRPEEFVPEPTFGLPTTLQGIQSAIEATQLQIEEAEAEEIQPPVGLVQEGELPPFGEVVKAIGVEQAAVRTQAARFRAAPAQLLPGRFKPKQLEPITPEDVAGIAKATEQEREIARQLDVQVQAKKDRVNSLMSRLQRLYHRGSMIAVIPKFVQAGATQADVLEKFGEFLSNPNDRRFATALVDQATEDVQVAEERKASMDERRDIVRDLSKNRSISTYGLGQAMGMSLLEKAIELTRPQLPEGMTTDDLRAVVDEAGIPSDESQVIIDFAEDEIGRIVQEMREVDARFELIRSDLAKLELDDLEQAIADARFKNMISQPGLALLLPYEYYRRKFLFPLLGVAAEAFKSQSVLFGPPAEILRPVTTRNVMGLNEREAEFFESFERAKADEGSLWEAYGQAFEDWEGNAFLKLALEILVDPLTYMGFGVATRITRPVPLLGGAVAGLERGWLRAADLPFAALKHTMAKIPKTPAMAAVAKSISAVEQMALYLERVSDGVPFLNQSASSIRSKMMAAVNYLERNPMAENPVANAARPLVERPSLTVQQVNKIASQLDAVLPEHIVVDGNFVSQLDSAFSYTNVLNGKALNLDEAADFLLQKMGANRTLTTINTAKQIILGERQKILRGAENVLAGKTAKEILENLLKRVKTVTEINSRSETSLARTRMGILAANLEGWPLSSKVSHAFQLANRFSMGFARMYLMFSLYTPWNILENAGKTAYARLNPFYRGNEVALLQAEHAGLAGQQEMFLRASEFVLQQAPVAETVAASRSRLVGTTAISLNTYRRLVQKQSPLWKKWLYDVPDAIFVKTGGRVGMQQAAHAMRGLFRQHMWRRHPEIMGTMHDAVLESAGPLKAVLDKQTRESVMKEAERLAVVSPDSLPTMNERFTASVIHMRDIQEKMSKYPLIGTEFQDWFQNLLDNNTFFKLLSSGELDNTAKEMLWSQVMASPDIARQNISTLVDTMKAHIPASLDDLKLQIQALQHMSELYTQVVHSQLKGLQAYTRKMQNVEAKNAVYDEVWGSTLEPFMTTGERKAEELTAHLTEIVNTKGVGFGLNEAQRVQYEQLLKGHLDHIKLSRQAREGVREFEQFMINDPVEGRRAITERIRVRGEKVSGHPEIDQWWDNFNSGRAEIWDKAEEGMFENEARLLELGSTIENLPLPIARSVLGRPLTPADLSYLYTTTPAELTAGIYIPDLMAIRGRKEFVTRIRARAEKVAQAGGATADQLGYTKEAVGTVYDSVVKRMRGTQEADNLFKPRFDQWEALRKELVSYSVEKRAVLTPEAEALIKQYSEQVLGSLKQKGVYMGRGLGKGVNEEWMARRQEAWDGARQEWDLLFPDYEHGTALSAGMRFLFPFWTYEAHRATFLPRMWLRTPGTYTAWGKYEDYTDRGYLHIPGTSWEINPTRGTILMGGMTSLMRRDFPEFYDRFPELSNTFDQAARVGFFPNIFISGFFAGGIGTITGESQIGEVLPPMVRGPLELLNVVDPGNPFVEALSEIILPNRFRDYLIANKVSDRGKFTGEELLTKRRLGQELTAEEKAEWEGAQRGLSGTSAFTLANDQVSLFRMRPEERILAQQLAMQVYSDFYNIPVKTLEDARKKGLRFEEFIPDHPVLKDILNDVAEIAQWRGLTTGLGESAVGRMNAVIRQFWQSVEDKRTRVTVEQNRWDNMLKLGEINLADWEFQRKELSGQIHSFIESLRNSPAYKLERDKDGRILGGVPITQEERLEWSDTFGTLPPIDHPLEELISLFFERAPEDFRIYDPEAGTRVIDWNGFFAWREAIEGSLSDNLLDEFRTRIGRWDTELERIRRNDYQVFIQPYRNAFDFVLETYKPEEQAQIKEFYFTDEHERRAELREIVDPEGQQLISQFQTVLREFRQNMRQVDPELDARLTFWGVVQTPTTDAASEIVKRLRIKRGFA